MPEESESTLKTLQKCVSLMAISLLSIDDSMKKLVALGEWYKARLMAEDKVKK